MKFPSRSLSLARWFFSTGAVSVLIVFGSQSCGKADTTPDTSGSASRVCTSSVVNFNGNAATHTSGSGNTLPMVINDPGVATGGVGNAYPNEPTVSVTLCSPGTTSNCITIDHLLLDTGSYGLRVFSSAISAANQAQGKNVAPVPVTNGGATLAECVQFGDGSSEWGPVAYANIQMGTEGFVQVPIHMVDSNYQSPPSLCTSSQSTPDTSPEQAGYNGILGVGLFAQDCGSYCVTHSESELYYTCNGASCYCGATADLNAQVRNPVDALASPDNRGVTIDLTSASAATAANPGLVSASGTITFGANATGSSDTYYADGSGNMRTTYAGYSASPINSFIDSGSSVLFIPPAAGYSSCGTVSNQNLNSIFCGALATYTTTNASATGTNGFSKAVTFQVGQGSTFLLSSSDNVFSALAATSVSGSTAIFDWGLPFFIGRKVHVQIGFSTNAATSGYPYWNY